MKKAGKGIKKEGLLMLAWMTCLAALCVSSVYPKCENTEHEIRMGEVPEAAAYVSASVKRESPKIAITFDDGPSGSWTPSRTFCKISISSTNSPGRVSTWSTGSTMT